MTNFRILILILAIGLNSCADRKNKAELKEVKSEKKVDNEKYDRFWITYQYPNDIQEKVEVYVSKEKDTVFNQIKTLVDDKLTQPKAGFMNLIL